MKKRHTPEQIVRMLREAEAELAAGASVPEIARKLGISEATFHRWRNQYGGMKADATKRLKELEKENARLKKIVAEQAVDLSILKEVSRKKLLSPTRRRAAVGHVRRHLGVSERRACEAIGQPRSTQRYVGRPKAEWERWLVERMVGLSRENPRYGYRRVWALLRREGWMVNKKRVHRLWREEGLKVPGGKQRKRLRLAEGGSENGCRRKRAGYRDHVWSYDFVMDRTEDGRRLKMMPVVDEHTRECLAIEVERSITAEDVIGTLARLFRQRGAPAFIRSDNGPEFVARTLKRWLAISEVGTLYIEPGSPWENAYSESFIGRFGDELLKREAFAGLVEAKVLVEDYREHHNHRRPHSALGYRTPSEFAASCRSAGVDAGIVKELQSATALS
ncbi:MAG: IS3 family transposase [Actinomycetota bacterium]|nr:IS3 family transposase [Actinomycetota bacterium]